MKITLPYPPTVGRLWATVRNKRTGGTIRILSERGKKYKADVAAECTLSRLRPFSDDVAVTFTAYRPRKTGDLDNLAKALFDSLKGFAWIDDKQIIEIHAYRRDDKNNPRVEVEILECTTQKQ